MGTGGAPEGVITAAALRCVNGEILGRLVPKDEAQAERIRSMGIRDPRKIFRTEELAPGKEIIFAASGVTEGSLLKGVRFFGEGVRVNSLVMTCHTRSLRFIDAIHLSKRPDYKVRLF
jgi:fructose-1,6-bisphosphatase II